MSDALPLFISPADVAENQRIAAPTMRHRCPFCMEWVNIEAVLYGSVEDSFPTYRVLCGNCGSAGPVSHSPQLAWKLWNKRKMEPVLEGGRNA